MAKSNSDFVFHTDDDVEFFSAELFELMNVSFSAPYDPGVGRHVLWRNHQVGRSVRHRVIPPLFKLLFHSQSAVHQSGAYNCRIKSATDMFHRSRSASLPKPPHLPRKWPSCRMRHLAMCTSHSSQSRHPSATLTRTPAPT